jgi:uncharacterized RDD family membrane protein YckC
MSDVTPVIPSGVPPVRPEDAPVRSRAIAAFLDLSLVLLPALLGVSAGVARWQQWMPGNDGVLQNGMIVGITAFVLLVASQCALLVYTGQSYGKLAAHIRIVRNADSGKVAPLTMILWRTLVPGLLWVFVPFALIDVGVGLIRKDGRCIHDMMAGTRVVKG